MTHHDGQNEVQRLLAPLSTGWVRSVTGVSGETVAQWRNGAEPRPDRWERLVVALKAVLPETEQAPRPDWVEGLEARLVDEIRKNRDAIAGRVDAASAEQEELQQALLERLGVPAPPRRRRVVPPAARTPSAGGGTGTRRPEKP